MYLSFDTYTARFVSLVASPPNNIWQPDKPIGTHRCSRDQQHLPNRAKTRPSDKILSAVILNCSPVTGIRNEQVGGGTQRYMTTTCLEGCYSPNSVVKSRTPRSRSGHRCEVFASRSEPFLLNSASRYMSIKTALRLRSRRSHLSLSRAVRIAHTSALDQ